VTALLRVADLHVSYGSIAALHGISLDVNPGELVAIIGPNGAGKSTLLRTIAGLIMPRRGSVVVNQEPIVGRPPERLVAAGISLVPEGRHIFGSLTVDENLRLGATTRRDGRQAIEADVGRLLALFPVLGQRLRQRAGQLSGGEQQMLAIARILRTGAPLLLLDEPTEGLAPVIVQHIGRILHQLKERGFTILLVEQNFHFAAGVADRHYVVEHGRVIDCVANAGADLSKLKSQLGV
jgi:branched-chain amino acid transport system ATP-binding protein